MPRPVKRATAVLAPIAILLASPAPALAAAKPAAGAAIGQVIIATVGAIIFTAVLLGLVIGHRNGRLRFTRKLVAFSERVSGMPNWSAIPLSILGGTLLIAVYGMYWDISIHLDKGRDPGPLANAAHYFILIGLFGVLFAGVVAMALSLERPSRSSIRLPNGWEAPLGGLIITFCGSISLLAFPLDDIWHRLFGQDVTLWGPTHLLLFGGASFSIVGAWILHREGKAASIAPAPKVDKPIFIARWREPMLAGAFLIGLSTFQGEFDFGVPQFRLVWHPILLALAAGVGLVAARLRMGRGGAFAALGFFLLVRGGLALIVGPIVGHTTPKFPLYIAEACLVELVALRIPRDRPITFGAVAGAAIGTIGLAAEWGWSHVFWTNPWPSSLFPEGAIAGLVAGVAGRVLGGFIGRAIQGRPTVERVPRWAVPAAALAVIALVAYAIPMPAPKHPPTATVSLTTVKPPPKREVQMTVRLHPPGAAHNARWFTATAWQGGGSVIQKLKPVGPGLYRTTKPIPVYGNWKATIRLQRGSEVLGAPVFFAADPAIPAPAIPANAHFTRPFVKDKKLLQREQKPGVSPVLTIGAYSAVLAIGLFMFGLLAWALVRLERTLRSGPPVEPKASSAPRAKAAAREATPA